jgi:hypothetical protein
MSVSGQTWQPQTEQMLSALLQPDIGRCHSINASAEAEGQNLASEEPRQLKRRGVCPLQILDYAGQGATVRKTQQGVLV